MTCLDSLCYTDCRAGEGLAAGPGFGFRAASPAVAPAVLRLVQEACLYEPPDVWMDRQRAVGDYPRSLAHIARDGRYVTASGCYLGVEVKGSLREGNHFTHALATDTAEGYGQVRPAQLWASPVWREEAGEGTEWPVVTAPPDPGPFDAATLQRWVGAQPGGEQMLLAVCSALERVRDGGPRLLFVADDPRPVLAWVAAGTLLLPRPDALRIGFKVFVRDVASGAHDVVALHPDWAGAFRGAGADRGFAVFDLVDGVRSEVPRADGAAFWVPRFLHLDCFDVLDAVELSGVFRTGAVAGRPERLAAAVLALDEVPGGPEMDVLLGWLVASGAATLPARRRRELLERLLAAGPDAQRLRGIAGLAERLDEPSVRERIRWHVFAREVDAALGGQPGRPDPRDRAGATRELAARLDAAAPEQVVNLLTVAADHGLDPDPATFRNGLRGFVRWWVDGALDVPELQRWPCRDAVLELVRRELGERLRAAPEASRRSLGELWWRRLWPTVRDARTEPDATLAAAAVAHGTPDERREVTENILVGLGDPAPPDALDVARTALWALRTPEPGELLAVLERLGPGAAVSPETARAIEAAFDTRRDPSPAVTAVLLVLDDRGVRLGPGRAGGWQQEALGLRVLAERIAKWDQGAATVAVSNLEAVNTALSATSVGVLRSAAGAVVGALGGLNPLAGAEVLVQAHATKRAALTGHLERTLPEAPEVPVTALAHAVAVRLLDVERTAAARMRVAVRAAAAGLDDDSRRAVGERLDTRLRERWEKLCDTPLERPGRWWNRQRR